MASGWDIANVVATIVGAVGTTSAVVVALGIAIRDGRAMRSEREYQEAAQARSVVSEVPTPHLMRISSHSREPILAVRVTGLSARVDRVSGDLEHHRGLRILI